MSIAGNLNSMPLEDLLGWLASSGQTGTLVIDGPSSTKKLVVEDGVLTATSSTDPDESLSRFLIGWGMVGEERLEGLFALRDRHGQMVGQQLIDQGLVSEEDLGTVLAVVAREVVCDAFSWPTGSFRFLDGVLPAHRFHPLSLALTPLTLEGARRVDEGRRIREVIPSSLHRPRRGTGFAMGDLAMSEFEMIVDLDGGRSFEVIADGHREAVFETLERLHPLVRRGVVEVLAPSPEGRRGGWASSVRAQLLRAEVALSSGRLLQASRIVDELRAALAGDSPLGAEVEAVGREVKLALRATRLDPGTVLEVAIPREELFQLQCGPEEGFILSRIDGRSTVAQIFAQVPGDDHAKHLVLLDLLDRGVLALQA